MSINVAYACNEVYMEQTMVSLVSLFTNCSVPNKLHIFFIDMGIESDSKEDLSALINSKGAKLTVIPFEKIAYDLNIAEKTGRHIKSVYAKLFFGRITAEERIVYLDSDIVVAGDIKDLWEIDLGENVCAGVETLHSAAANKQVGYLSEERAINDGVVLMDLKKWREEHYLEKCLEYIALYHGEPPVLSEGTINAVCKGKIKIIHPRFNLLSAIVGADVSKLEKLTGRNYYSQKEINDATANPCIIHYLSAFYNRPWCKNCTHPLKEQYLYYRRLTKWADKPLQDKELPIRLKMVGYAYNYLPVSMFKLLQSCFGHKSN